MYSVIRVLVISLALSSGSCASPDPKAAEAAEHLDHHQVVSYEGDVSAEAMTVAAAPLACNRPFDLHLRFQGIAHLVSERVASPPAGEFWVLFPKTDRAPVPANVPPDLVIDRHEPNLFFVPGTVQLTGVGPTALPQPCPAGLPGCSAVNLTGFHVESAAGGPLTMDWTTPAVGTSLRLLADSDRLTADTLGATAPVKASFSPLLTPTVAGDPLMARFRGTSGHVKTHSRWGRMVRFAPRGLPAVRSQEDLARAFEVEIPVNGCTTFVIRDLTSGGAVGSVRVGSPTGADVDLVIDHHPTSNVGCLGNGNGHFLSHYLFRNVAGVGGARNLVELVIPGATSPCGNPQCSPSCSERP